MSKKRKSKEAKQAHKPIHGLVPDASHTGDYADKMSQPQHTQLSSPTQQMDHPAKQLPTPQGGAYWGDSGDMSTMMAAQAASGEE